MIKLIDDEQIVLMVSEEFWQDLKIMMGVTPEEQLLEILKNELTKKYELGR